MLTMLNNFIESFIAYLLCYLTNIFDPNLFPEVQIVIVQTKHITSHIKPSH